MEEEAAAVQVHADNLGAAGVGMIERDFIACLRGAVLFLEKITHHPAGFILRRNNEAIVCALAHFDNNSIVLHKKKNLVNNKSIKDKDNKFFVQSQELKLNFLSI